MTISTSASDGFIDSYNFFDFHKTFRIIEAIILNNFFNLT